MLMPHDLEGPQVVLGDIFIHGVSPVLTPHDLEGTRVSAAWLR